MNEQTAKQLIRQLKIINFWISFYGVIMITVLAVLAAMIYQVVTFMHDTSQRVDSLRNSASDSMNVKKQLCEGEGPVADVVKSNTELCK